MFPEKKFDANGVLINYAEGPASGPPLILLHGLPGCWQEFLPILPHLILRWHIYALDFRGQGNSGRTPGQYHSSFYPKDLVSFLQQQLTEPAVLFGNSAGGLVALAATTEIPHRVRAIILGDSPIDMEWLVGWMTSIGFKTWFTALRSIAAASHTFDEIMEQLASIHVNQEGEAPVLFGDQPDTDQIDLRGLALTLNHLDPGVLDYHAEGRAEEFLQGYDLNRFLENIACPVLLVQANSELGGLMTKRSVENALARLKHGYHVLINTAGHDLGMESWQVDPLLRAVTGFLNTL